MSVDRDLGNRLRILRHLPHIPDDRSKANSKIHGLHTTHNISRQRPLECLAARNPLNTIIRLFQITFHQSVERVLDQQPHLIAIVENTMRKLRIHSLHIPLQPQRLLRNVRSQITHLLQTLLDYPELRQSAANRPDLFQVSLRELFLRNYLDRIMTSQIVCGNDSSEKVRSITNIRINNITEVLPLTGETRINGYSAVRFSSESNNIPLFETNLFNPVFRQRYDEG